MYTQHDFRADLMALEDALSDGDPMQLANAIARGRSLLTAGGAIGSIVSGNNRADLTRVLARCESHQVAVAGLVTVEGAAPKGTIDPAGMFSDNNPQPQPTGSAGDGNVDP